MPPLAIATTRALHPACSPARGRMEQHTTLKAEHEALTSAHQQIAIELREATKQRNTWKEECDRQTEMVQAKQDNLEQCTRLLTGRQKSALSSSPSATPPQSASDRRAREPL